MKSLLLLHCYLFFIGYSLAANDGECEITGIDDNDYLTVYTININDTQIDTNVLEAPYTGELEVIGYEGINSSYFFVTTENGNFVIKTTPELENFDQNVPKQESNSYLISLLCLLQCKAGTSSLTVRIFVNDINTHPPEFSLQKYEYKVPSPLMPRTDFSIYGDAGIIATDIDFSNQNIVFDIDPDDFSVITSSSATSKDYAAIFAANRVIQLSGNRTYTITATDSGTIPGPLSSTTTLTLIVDESTSLDIPSFEESSYSFNYTVDGSTAKLTNLDGPITIITNKANFVTDVTLTGDYRDDFHVEFNEASRTFELSVTELLPTDTGSFIILTLSAATDNTAVTSLIIYLPEGDETPEFSSHFYIGSYKDDSSTVVLDTPIEVTSARIPDVTLSGDFAEHFTVAYDEKTKSCNIAVKSALTISEIKSNPYVTVMLRASIGENYDTAALILSLPEHVLQFTKALYTATYNSNDSITIDEESLIGFTTESEGIDIEIGGTYEEFFGIAYNSGRNQWTLVVTKPLTTDILKTEKELVITLTAVDAYDDQAQSVVIVQLPEVITDAPKFSEAYYLVDYTVNGDTPSISIDEDILISNRDDQSSIKITLDSYTDNFDISYDKAANKWIFKLLLALTEDILLTKKELLITLTAEEDNNTNKGQAVLVVTWITKEALKFSQAYYTGIYPENETGTIDVQPTISFNNMDNPTNIAISLDSYADNFDVSYESNKWTVTIKKKLEKSTLTTYGELLITLTATESDTKNEAQSVLVIELPAVKKPPEFSKTYYIGEYPKSGKGTIELETDISFTNVEDPTTVVITLDTYADNFEIAYAPNKWSINIKKSLEPSIIHQNTDLVVTLTASESGVDGEGESVLVLKLPTALEATAPKFADAYYIGEYPENGTGVIELEIPIQFSNVDDLTEITISLDNYVDNFDINYASNVWYINIKTSLEEAILHKNTELVMTMIATESGNNEAGESALVIKLPTANEAIAPHFVDAYYIAEYPEDPVSVIEFENPIRFANVDDPSKITINLDNYADTFDVSYEEDKWHINVKKSLEKNILLENVELVMSLIATEAGNIEEGKSALVLKLPSAVNGTAPKFSKPYYIAEYPENNADTIEFENPVEFTNVEDLTKLTISLDQFTDNFEINYNANKWNIVIKKPLEKSVLYHNVELVMSLIANEDGNNNEGYSALVLKLPTATEGTAPKFSDAYYIAEYPETGSGTIGFDHPISFTNVDDPTQLVITLDKFGDNFEITYESNKWQLNIKKNLEANLLHNNVELVMSLIATEAGYDEPGLSALIVKLPTAINGTAPKFLDAYYLAEYPEEGTGIIEFENPIQFVNVAEPTEVSIALDKYATNFEIIYRANRWYLNIKEGLEDSVLHTNVELVMTLVATVSESNEVGESALILKLPTAAVGTAPIFSEAYYLAKYPKNGTGVIEFDSPVEFTNVEDITKIGITIDQYGENFEILYDSNRWYINIKKSLEEPILHKNVELAFTLIATESGSNEEGRSALVLELPTAANESAIEFSEAYYFARYPINGSGIIEFETPLKFKNIVDPQSVEISLSEYSSNFDLVYDGKEWHINIIESLDESVLIENAELVMTLTAYNSEEETKGYSVLILSLPSPAEAPKFSEAYYLAEYPENGTGIIEFKRPVTFSNVENPIDVKITLDNYLDNLEIVYSSARWYINIIQKLEDNVLSKNVDLIMTMTATETGHKVEGEATLVLRLPNAVVAPEFTDAYYLAEYPENGTGLIEFETPITFLNVEDPTTIAISIDNYPNNFDVKYGSNRWYINIKNKLEKTVLNENAELVMTLIASELDNKSEGYAALVLKLPAAAKATAPEFAEAYYIAEYPEDGTGVIQFKNPIEFLNVDDLQSLSIATDTYSDYFEVTYASDTWNINIKKSLGNETLTKNVELVMTLIATETGNENKGYSALVLKLPTAASGTAIKFSETYYVAEYPESGEGAVEIKNAIQFLNVDNIQTVNITLDSYQDNFEITYAAQKWLLNINKGLDEDTLNDNAEVVMTLIATNSADNTVARAALILKLPDETGPIFSEAYYTAEYPDEVKDVIEFDNPITFDNVNDPSKITITLEKYTEYFDIKLVSNQWYIQIKNTLEESIVNENTELVTTLIASEVNKENQGYSALVLKLPTTNATKAPEFSKAYYLASYTSNANQKPSIILTDPIDIINREDLNKITITVDDYQENVIVIYDSDKKTWTVDIVKQIPDTILLSKTDLVISLTATDITNGLKGHSVIDLTLPSFDSDTAPKFSKTYYTGKYEFSDNTPIVTLNSPINITNKDDLTDISINVDNYADNFKIQYVAQSNEWKVSVEKNLEEPVLNARIDLVMTLTAIDSNSNEAGQCTLVLTLPLVNTNEAPKFSSIYYSGQYDTTNGRTINLDNPVEIINKNDFTKVKINFDDSYKDNFDINYDAGLAKWVLDIKSPLNESILKDNIELILTLTATEIDNTDIGQATLVLELPVEAKLPPRFSLAHYSAEYVVVDQKASIVLNDTITIANKEVLTDISVTLDSYETNLKVTYDPSNEKWILNVNEILPEDVLNSNSELVLTLIATEADNEYSGESTLILALPSSHEEVIKFSHVHYIADYTIENQNVVIDMDGTIEVESKEDLTNLKVSLENEELAEYFEIKRVSDTYEVDVRTPLPSTILGTYVSIPLTLVATLDDSVAYATLVINLPPAATSDAIHFSKPLYEGTYKVADDGTVSFQVNEIIEVETEAEDANVEKSITSNTGYEGYFGISYSNNILTVVKTSDLPENVLRSNSIIPLILTVGISGTTDSSSTVLNVAIDFSDDEDARSIVFSSVLYRGKYEVIDGVGDLTIDNPISVITDEPDGNVNVIVTNEYDNFFTASYSANIVTVTLKQDLSTDILNNSNFISVTLQASITGTSSQESAVLNIIIIYDSEEDPGLIEFSEVLYTGQYSVDNGKSQLVLDEEIKIITDAADNQIKPSVSDGSDYAKYFEVTYASNVLSIELVNDAPQDAFTNTTLIALTLTVEITGTTHRSFAVLNIINDVSENGHTRSIEFSDVLYNGKYEVTDGNGVLTVDDEIKIITTESDTNVTVIVSNEYDGYFTASYSNNNVLVELEKPLSSEILNSSSFVPVTLLASISGLSHHASAVLNVIIYYDGEDDTGLIEFSSVLYNAEYSITDEGGQFIPSEEIKVITNRPDNEIEASISKDSEYSDHFTIAYASHIVTIGLKENLPEDILTRNSFIALTLTVGITGTTQRSSAVLNIDIDNDGDSKSCDVPSNTAYISAISVLSILLIALIAAAVAFYFFKIRKRNYSNLEEEDGRIRYNKHSLKRSSSEIKPSSSLDERRPTGFIFNPISEDSIDGTDSIGEPDIRRKSVAFDDNVEKLQLEVSNEEDNVSEDTIPNKPDNTHA